MPALCKTVSQYSKITIHTVLQVTGLSLGPTVSLAVDYPYCQR